MPRAALASMAVLVLSCAERDELVTDCCERCPAPAVAPAAPPPVRVPDAGPLDGWASDSLLPAGIDFPGGAIKQLVLVTSESITMPDLYPPAHDDATFERQLNDLVSKRLDVALVWKVNATVPYGRLSRLLAISRRAGAQIALALPSE